MARIAYGGFMHESNSFAPGISTWEMFCTRGDRPPFSRAAEVPSNLRNAAFATSGFLDVMEGKHDLVPLVWGSVLAGPPVSREAYERIAAELVAELSRALPLDALYLDLHGAMVSEDFEDGEGELLRRVRAAVGPRLPVVVSLDYHSNVTPAMVEYSDALVPYHTYPHVDRTDTGVRAARVVETVLQRGRPIGRALRKPDFLIPLNAQCTEHEPSKSIVAASVAGAAGEVLTLAYLAGFPPSDLADCGPAIIAHAYTQEAADAAADQLHAMVCSHEVDFAQPMLEPDEAVKQAMAIAARASRPVVIADTQDNPGAGGTADTTGMLEALVRCDAKGAVLAYLNDPEAAAAAHAAGVGASITVALGGKSGPQGVKPFSATFRVAALGDGAVIGTGPMARGRKMDLGPMAALEIGGVKVIVTTRRMQAHDQAPMRHVGIDPTRQKLLVLKSTVHFRADFGPLAECVIVALAPGMHLVDPGQFPYRRLRPGVRLRPLGPKFAAR